MLVCRALPLALATAGFVHITPTEPPGLPLAPSAYVQPMEQGQFVPPYQTPGPPQFPNPFACCGGQYPLPRDPGFKVPWAPPVGDPGPSGDPGPPGDPPVITTYVDPGPPTNPVDEPSSGIIVLGGLAGLFLLRGLRMGRT
jgi:hypothetical protein